jgi:hypothetical protein
MSLCGYVPVFVTIATLTSRGILNKWQTGMLHVFASDGEKFGDTFFMHVPSFAYRAERVALLEWYDCNFVSTSVPRRPMPVIEHNLTVKQKQFEHLDWAGPLAMFTTTGRISSETWLRFRYGERMSKPLCH